MTVRSAVAKTELDKAANPGQAMAEAVADGKVKASAILRAVGIDPTNPVHQAALLAAQRYDLDPLLKHIIVIPNGGVYITRDGWLHIAHRTGQLDGIEVVDVDETPDHWTAKVAVWRKDMGRPFTYAGRYPKKGSNSKYGPEMAVKVAEVASLRRAFPVSGVAAYEERWDAIDVDETPQGVFAEVSPPAVEWDEDGDPRLVEAE
jgi:hypothetical protein